MGRYNNTLELIWFTKAIFMSKNLLSPEYLEFLDTLKQKVATSRYQATRAVNRELIMLYHHIGTEILARQTAHSWGAKIIEQLSRDLTSAFPEMKGFSTRNLKYMRLFAQTYPDLQFVQVTLAQLTWYHNITLLNKIKDSEERFFYLQKAVHHGWSTPVMVHQIELNLYQRQGKTINNFKESLPSPHSDLANQTLKDPYIFDFLGIGKEAHEREIEKSLIKHMEKFLLELGDGFAFVGRQYH